MKSSPLGLLLPPVLAVAAVACGSLDGHTEAPSLLASVQGELSLDTTAPSGLENVHIAIIWQTSTPDQFNVAEDLPVQPVFPSRYTLALTGAPPSSVIMHNDAAPGFGFAYGVLVAYEDLNADGKLDLISADAGAFVDRIVATNLDRAIVYLDSTTGSLPPGIGVLEGHPTLGYNLLTRSCTPVDGTQVGPDGGYCDWDVFLPITDSYDLPFSNDPKLSSFMCQNGASTASGSSATGSSWNVAQSGAPPDGYPVPGSSGLACSPDGSSYATHVCVTYANLCDTSTSCTDSQVMLGGAPPPAGWPCP